MVDECHSLSLSCGIYGGKNSWVAIFGSATAYTYPATQGLPLWYAHYDNSPSFSDWTAYGGGSAPSIKQYLGDETSCGASIDYNWVPDSLASLQHASARQLQDEPFYDLYCPLGHSERAPCGLVLEGAHHGGHHTRGSAAEDHSGKADLARPSAERGGEALLAGYICEQRPLDGPVAARISSMSLVTLIFR